MFTTPKTGIAVVAFILTLFWSAVFSSVAEALGYNVPGKFLWVASVVVFATAWSVLNLFFSIPKED